MNSPQPSINEVLAQETKTYEARKAELLRTSAGKYVLISADDVVGVFDSYAAAAECGWERFGNVPLFVKEIAAVDVPRTFSPTALEPPCDESATPFPTSLAAARSSR